MFDKEIEHDQVIDEQEETMDTDMHQGHREAGLQQLPQQPWESWVGTVEGWVALLQFCNGKKKAQEHKPEIIFLMETKLSKDKSRKLLEKCGFLDGWEVPRRDSVVVFF